tara:strand:+ start:3717 stop:4196 length:480 start_codon:yes stop_codon:yes gene_type:complete
MNALRDIFPEDIVNLIFTFNPDHRENFSFVIKSLKIKDIPLKGIFRRLEYFKDNGDNLESITDPEYFCKILATCTCCERHQKNRPKHFNDFETLSDDSNANYSPFNRDFECICSCRHDSRFIIRFCNNDYNYDSNIIYDSENDYDYEYEYEYDYDYNYL